jgi:hypothetical protein
MTEGGMNPVIVEDRSLAEPERAEPGAIHGHLSLKSTPKLSQDGGGDKEIK